MSEVTVYAFKAALYALDEACNEWILNDDEDEDAVAQYYVFMDEVETSTPKFRMVGWVEDTGDVVLNDPLTKDCIWLPVNEYFVQFTTSGDVTVGLSFVQVDQAQEASTVVRKILQNLHEMAENNRVQSTTADDDDTTSKRTAELKEYLTFVRTHGASSLEYLHAFYPADVAVVVDDLDTLLPSSSSLEDSCIKHDDDEIDGLEEEGPHATTRSFLSDEDRQSLRVHYAAAQLSDELPKAPPPQQRRSFSIPLSPPAAPGDEIRRGSVPLGTAPYLRRCSSRSMHSSSAPSSRNSSRRQSLADFDEVEKATMAAVDSNLHEENNPTSLSSSFTSCSFLHSAAMLESCRDVSSIERPYDHMQDAHDDQISRPYQTTQEVHVTFNAELARYEGLPAAWQGLNKQFGLPMDAVPKRKVDGYDGKVPAVLQMMKEYLVHHGGLDTEGIFRLAPDKALCNQVKDAINNGTFVGCSDVHIVSNLIKVWFRELPISLFNAIPEKSMYKACELKDAHDVMAVLKDVPQSTHTVILWLLDLMADVVKHEAKTKMSSKNMAIVLSPNLFSIASDNPMVALTMSQKVAEFTTVLLNARLALHHGYVK
ncbi:Aste57867_11298 [Aphanomyces stellatus]|uniref:Aste57867_11298 protein n=1 Tax=Aphanomyces stellatus TaxID=120398 RepID=A0A485KTR9_9STRA|nr:hypothetical protein As57867_011256 [Aphanomyces stellatus]VFT88160.1 Aste57867_11298 [Aphanomyces stellatus]